MLLFCVLFESVTARLEVLLLKINRPEEDALGVHRLGISTEKRDPAIASRGKL